ncbi:MAG: branched-chain amino acid ABC transporter permease, partial [Nitrospinota bacterium]
LPFAVPEALRGTAFTFENTDFSRYRVFLICVTFALAVFLWLLLNRTKLGMLIRAGTSDPLMVEVLGVDIRKIWSISFGLGISLAAFAGVMVGPIFAVQPTMGEVVLIQSFIVVIVGGMGSFWGAVISGIIVGQVLTVFPLIPYLEPAADVLIYLLMVTVLVLRPRGLFGEEGIFTE